MQNAANALQSVAGLLILWLMFTYLPWGEDDKTPLEKLLRWVVSKLIKVGKERHP